MNPKKWGLIGLAAILLFFYNGAQPGLIAMRTNDNFKPGTKVRERYGPSLEWLDRLIKGKTDKTRVKLDFTVLSSMMVAGLASGFKSQVANLLWMKSDEFWHSGLAQRQIPLMEAVVTLDPEFLDAWSTAGWHWAYNIYAEHELDPKLKPFPKKQREAMDYDIDTGLDYLKRGSEMNPDKYRLYFEHGWTRAEKKGLYDEETAEIYRTARSKGDARTVIRESMGPDGKPIEKEETGLDVVGRTIGHLYEQMPEFDKALDHYAKELLRASPQERAQLDIVGEYWHRYGENYDIIYQLYKNGDPTLKARIKSLVPDVERLVKAQELRLDMQNRDNGNSGQPTGAYVSITARYIPAWKLMKQGNLREAIKTIVGVMNGDTRYHLPDLPALGKVLELRGDAPQAIAAQLKEIRLKEARATQDIGLKFLAKLYEKMAQSEQDPKKQMAYYRLGYETWYRSRERSTLDFYAKRQTYIYEDKYNFTPPQTIIDQVRASRRTGDVNAAPKAPTFP